MEWDSFSKKTRVRQRTYLLTGLLQHQDGSPYGTTGGTSKTGAKKYYYRNDKHKLSIDADKLEEKVIQAISAYQDDAEIKEYVLEATRQLQSNVAVLDKQIVTLKDQLKENKKKEDDLMGALLSQKKTERTSEWLDRRLAELEQERKDLETNIVRMERERTVLADSEPDLQNVKATLEYVFKNFKKAEPSIQRNFMRQVFERIVVMSKQQVKVFWRFPEIAKPIPSIAACGGGGNGLALEKDWGDRPLHSDSANLRLIFSYCRKLASVKQA